MGGGSRSNSPSWRDLSCVCRWGSVSWMGGGGWGVGRCLEEEEGEEEEEEEQEGEEEEEEGRSGTAFVSLRSLVRSGKSR